MSQKRQRLIETLETVIIFIIAGCMIFLNTFTMNKISELERVGSEAMFIKEGIEFPESDELADELIKYRPDAYKMIEMYNENFDLVFAIQFQDSYKAHEYNIKAHPELMSELKKQSIGQITVVREDSFEEEVYFQWLLNDHNERRLVIVYSSKEKVENIWVFSFVSYLVLILVFLLLVMNKIKSYIEKIDQYRDITNSHRQEVYRK